MAKYTVTYNATCFTSFYSSISLTHVRDRKQEAGSRKQEAGSRKQEAGSRKQEAGSRKQEAGSRKQEAGIIRGGITFLHDFFTQPGGRRCCFFSHKKKPLVV
ncbi:hypothetical protein [Larsenimonas rhizosphaerae]|uniref:Uncharacterized protein n=1 Tax=Larsenimonas rhizosphaerae TaxID=2944682 RepID=A0AA42CW63_9GAMM|nr:hypothetical protein [Larsenimonas rhizosphaerae]MCX2525576.1 hypothetical protein [Larsenimonas rhizosphaerae]